MKPNLEAVSKKTPAIISPAENAAIVDVLSAGERFGYGNMISWLQTAWAVHLVRGGMDEKTARLASGGSGYPLDWIDL
jgi:hypothetical protein